MGKGEAERRFVALAAVLCTAALAAGASQAVDAVRNAKDTVRQGEQRLEQMRQEIRNENYDAALHVLQDYRDAIKSAHAMLKNSGRNADKNPGGFKELQMHIRRILSRLDQAILDVPVEQREPFVAIRKELDTVDRELIDALFPRQPAKKAGENKPGRSTP
jgi:hypothetical protein